MRAAPARDRNELDALAAAVAGGEEQGGGIGTPGEAVHPAVQRFGEIGGAAGGALSAISRFAIWQASTDGYADAVLLDGSFTGHPNLALDTACTLYLTGTGDHIP